jgi:DNA-binding NtrC family response regulator
METLETRDPSDRRVPVAVPGVVVVFSVDSPIASCIPLRGGQLAIGRNEVGFAGLRDERISRDHAMLACKKGVWTLRDVESRNGTFLDGTAVSQEVSFRAPAVVRVGRTVLLAVDALPSNLDARPDSDAVGPVFQRVLAEVERDAQTHETLFVSAESGAGKELAARAYHRAGPHRAGPFVAVNCAAIPPGLAERLLFGAKRGAYSGADADAIGHLQAADRGVLFLDEIGELDLAVQAKLLRVFETGEVVPLGASEARKVKVRYCLATHRDLAAAAADGRFRSDFYYRITGAKITIPPLRERRVDIPWLVAHAIAEAVPNMKAHPQLVAECLERPWPGNARELLHAIRRSALRAHAAGSSTLLASDLDPSAGAPLAGQADATAAASDPLTREAIEAALAGSSNNVAAAATSLGVNRTTLHRRIRELGIVLVRRPVATKR